MILGIDPGNIYSAYCVVDEKNGMKPIRFGKVKNEELLMLIEYDEMPYGVYHAAIEMVACYGMAVGKEVFDTCVWIGRYYQALTRRLLLRNIHYIYRKDEKINLCGSMKAKDANIRQALIDRFAYGVPNGGKGSKKEPGFFYGFAADVWAAFAVAVTFYDTKLKGGMKK